MLVRCDDVIPGKNKTMAAVKVKNSRAILHEYFSNCGMPTFAHVLVHEMSECQSLGVMYNIIILY